MKISPIVSSMLNPAADVRRGDHSFDVVRRLEAPVWIFDIDAGRIIFANAAACKLWGASDEETLLGREMKNDMSSTVAKRLKQYQSDFLESDASFTELWTLYPKGEPKSVMVVFRGFPLADGRMAMQCEAVGETDDMPENLRSAEALLHTDVMITLYGMNGPPLYQNPAARNHIAPMRKEFSEIFVEQRDLEAFTSEIEAKGEYRLVTKVHTASGQRWYDMSAKKCSDAATGRPAILLTAIDVSELKEARDTARYLADRDQLTNLYNRAYLQAELAKMARWHDGTDCAVIFFDVDRFKLINDRYGHETGDIVLHQIGGRIAETLEKGDIAARLGGDEFVVLLKNTHKRADIAKRVSALRTAISTPIVHEKTCMDVTVSIGVTTFSPKNEDFTEVLSEADVALYASKQGGRNRTTYFSEEMGVAARARDQMEIELKRAVQNSEFILHYQPRLDIRSGTIVGVEGLVRWQHPERGIVMPNEFIPICEDTGIIEMLGRIVLETGCKQAIAWQLSGLDLNVSLNVSPRQFADDGFMRTLFDLSNLPDFPNGKIELEITENVLIGDHHFIAQKLRTITNMGYRIAIDDFGTGYSNLSYISRFPLTCLKIDRSFIDQLPDSGPIIKLILTLGQQIGATIVSEGVETSEQLDWLAKCDCEQAQGYLIARPLTSHQILSFLGKLGPGTPTYVN